MPHTGKPSGACQPCKQRHVKCDEARPACGKCVRAKRECVGYRDGLDLVLRDQNDSVKAIVERRKKPDHKSRSVSPLIPYSLSDDEETNAVCFFVTSWVLFPRDPQTDRGVTELLPLFFSKLRPGTPLSLSLAALSHFTYGAWERRVRNETPQMQAAYGKAISAIRAALQDPVECRTDETLMAILLLGFYEATVHAFQGKISPVTHFLGAAAMIKQREGSNDGNAEMTRRLQHAIRSNIVFRAIQFACHIDATHPVWRDDDETLHNPATLLDIMSIDVANLIHLETSITSLERETNQESIADLTNQAWEVDSRLAQWLTAIPVDWLPVSIPAKSLPQSIQDAGIYGDSCDVYPDIMVATTWNDWRWTRIRVLGLLARYKDDEQVHATIQGLADDICASVPFCFGDRTEPVPMYATKSTYPSAQGKPLPKSHRQNAAVFGGWYMLTPFKETVQVAKYLRDGQIPWILGQMQRLASIYGV